MDPKKEKAHGKVGLVNLGNSCFLNSVIQSLRYCTDFSNYFTSGAYLAHLKNDRPTAAIVEETADVFKGMWNGDVRARASMAPRGFVASSARISSQSRTFEDLFRGGQEDSAEALLFVLDAIHEGVSRKVKMDVVGTPKTSEDIHQIKALQAWSEFYAKGYSPVVEQFFGQQMTATICRNCKNKNSRFEPWMMIKAPIDTDAGDNQPLSSCIDKAFDKEVIDDYECDNCKTRSQVDLEHTISKLPPVIILSLKRWDNNNNKIRTKVNIDLDKTDFAKWISFPSVAKHISTEYTTFAVIEHHGGSRGGHYLSYAKHNGSWISYDDQQISDVPADKVINNDTYVLFMTRKAYVSPTPSYAPTTAEDQEMKAAEA
jgi:ubiquitin C-terminal hydrolase